jgi:aspartate carbamoyltransferase
MSTQLTGPFSGRTVAVVNDLSVDEQLYLYKKTAEFKKAYFGGGDTSSFLINDPDYAAYLLFFENSTRTKESFRNAVLYHKMKLNNFDVSTSSVTKEESLSDTVKMLFGYSKQSLFIIRSTREGVCRALEDSLTDYAQKIGYPIPAFINAGDGRHEHPTQEFLDEFTFLEKQNWDNNSIHIALLGDLYHGRTVHSKVDGLRIFKNVQIDMIAPPELQIPSHYETRMKENGFQIRKFNSIDEYLGQKKTADIWYFTRLQLERMGEEILGKADKLRQAVIFQKDFLSKIKGGTRFYHPLPRHRVHPTIPTFLDGTPLNGWDGQSINGFFTRMILIGMVGGKIGEDFLGQHWKKPHFDSDFVEEIIPSRVSKIIDRYKVGIKPVDSGIVIDHIGKGESIEVLWSLIDKIRRILNLNCRSSHGVFHSSDRVHFKGIISLPDIHSIDEKDIKKLAAIAPGCTLNIIENQSVLKKYRLHMPPRIYNFNEISCKNEQCISHPDLHENVQNDFHRIDMNYFKCKYCERTYSYQELWK